MKEFNKIITIEEVKLKLEAVTKVKQAAEEIRNNINSVNTEKKIPEMIETEKMMIKKIIKAKTKETTGTIEITETTGTIGITEIIEIIEITGITGITEMMIEIQADVITNKKIEVIADLREVTDTKTKMIDKVKQKQMT